MHGCGSVCGGWGCVCVVFIVMIRSVSIISLHSRCYFADSYHVLKTIPRGNDNRVTRSTIHCHNTDIVFVKSQTIHETTYPM